VAYVRDSDIEDSLMTKYSIGAYLLRKLPRRLREIRKHKKENWSRTKENLTVTSTIFMSYNTSIKQHHLRCSYIGSRPGVVGDQPPPEQNGRRISEDWMHDVISSW